MVVSRTLKPEEYPGVTVISSDIPEAVAALKAQPGKDIWLFGGGVRFRTLLDNGLVDAMDIAVIPVCWEAGLRCCRRDGGSGFIWRRARCCQRDSDACLLRCGGMPVILQLYLASMGQRRKDPGLNRLRKKG